MNPQGAAESYGITASMGLQNLQVMVLANSSKSCGDIASIPLRHKILGHAFNYQIVACHAKSIYSTHHITYRLYCYSLQHEPQRLSMEAERLNSELESLVMDNYRVFVENLTCSVHLRNEDKRLGEIAVDLGEELQRLGDQCSSFREKVQQFTGAFKRNRKTLQHHMQLVELLEVPQVLHKIGNDVDLHIQ